MDTENEIEIKLKQVFDDYLNERNNIPAYAEFLAKEKPEFLIKYFDVRRTFRGKGVLPEKFKEMLLCASAATQLNATSLPVHMRAAMRFGATKQELLEAGFCVWVLAAMPALNLWIKTLMKITDEKDK